MEAERARTPAVPYEQLDEEAEGGGELCRVVLCCVVSCCVVWCCVVLCCVVSCCVVTAFL
jgi:hypothetical protein